MIGQCRINRNIKQMNETSGPKATKATASFWLSCWSISRSPVVNFRIAAFTVDNFKEKKRIARIKIMTPRKNTYVESFALNMPAHRITPGAVVQHPVLVILSCIRVQYKVQKKYMEYINDSERQLTTERGHEVEEQ